MEPGLCCLEREAASRPEILLIEDDKDNRETMSELLEYLGYSVHSVEDGLQAQGALMVGTRPDLILLDLFMPQIDGRGLLTWLRSQPGTASIPVIVLSSFTTDSEEMEGMGVSATFLKPAVMPDLLDAVRNLVQCREVTFI